MKRIILTGATGFVGANLVRRLLKEGHEILFVSSPGIFPMANKGYCGGLQGSHPKPG